MKVSRYARLHIVSITLSATIFGVLVLLSLFSVALSKGEREYMVLTTEILEVASPHQHDAGEAVEDTGHHHYLMSKIITPSEDFWISDIAFEVVNAPDTTVHHADLIKLDTPHQNCPNVPFMQMMQFVQDNMHLKEISFPEGAGMRLKKGEQYRLMFMVHNPLPPVGPGGTYYNVYGQAVLSLYPPGEVEGLKEVHYMPLHLNQTPCNVFLPDGSPAFTFTVPPRTSDYLFRASADPSDPGRYTFKKDSTIVFTGAHMHGWQGARELRVEKNGEPFTSFSTSRSFNYPYRYDTPYFSTELSMKAGDTLTVGALYDNERDVEVRGAMGIYDIYFYEN